MGKSNTVALFHLLQHRLAISAGKWRARARFDRQEPSLKARNFWKLAFYCSSLTHKTVPDAGRKNCSAIVMRVRREFPIDLTVIDFEKDGHWEERKTVFHACSCKESGHHVSGGSAQHRNDGLRFKKDRESHPGRKGQCKILRETQGVFQAGVCDPLAPLEVPIALEKIGKLSDDFQVRNQRELNGAAIDEPGIGAKGFSKISLGSKEFSQMK